MKKYFYFATALVALAACSSNDYVGDQEALNSAGQVPISFSGGTPSMTRATGATAAGVLSNNFVLFGYKTVGTSEPQKVFDNYQVNFIGTSAYTSKSNSAGWEYVSYKSLPYGTTTTSGGTLNTDGVAANATASGIDQSVKYWDFNATDYNFFAYSLGAGAGTPKTWAKASAMSNSTFTLEGTADQLGTCYVSNKKTMELTTVSTEVGSTEVELEFRAISSKIELKFYETIPGYSIKEVKFYPAVDGTSTTTPYLYTGSAALPTGGKYTVTFDGNGKPQFTFDTSAESKTYGTNVAFSSTLYGYATKEYREADESYIGRASNTATYTAPITVLPNPQNDNALNIKMDFTLVSRDGSGETIEMKGASAVIPAAYAKWLPNYKYTYLFKISDNTNAKTAEITGLYPITLDAVVTDAEDGTQETVTTVDAPSITTYAKGTMVTAKNEYKTGANIYIVVNDGTNITADSDAKLYTATITLEEGANPRPAVQGITEETVANALAHGGSVTDANGAKLTVTQITGSLTDIDNIAANDAPNGHAITVDGVMFNTSTAGDYVFEYTAPGVIYYTEAEVNTYNGNLLGAISTADKAYSFTSYGATSGTPVYGTGKVKEVSKDDAWTTVLVTSNTPNDPNAASFVGQQFKVNATTITPGQYYQLYTTENVAQGIYVTVADSEFTTTEVNTYNATLPGHISTTDVKTSASKHYKVIKVVTGS